MRASVGYLVIDTTDPQRLAPFWCALLDVQVEAEIGDSHASAQPRLTLEEFLDCASLGSAIHQGQGHEFAKAHYDLVPVDEIVITTLVDNVYDALLDGNDTITRAVHGRPRPASLVRVRKPSLVGYDR